MDVIEAAQAQIRRYTIQPEVGEKDTFLKTLDRRYQEILSGTAKMISGEQFDAELEKID